MSLLRLVIVVALALLAGLPVTAGATTITAVSPSHAHRVATTGLTAAAADTQASKSARTTPLLNARTTALLAKPSLRTVPRSLTSSFSLRRATKGKQSLFHYTSEAGEEGIRKSGKLNPALEPPSARYGPGQYFTDLAPDAGLRRGQIARRLFGIPNAGRRLDRCIEIDVCGLGVEQVAPNIFRLPGTNPLDVSRRIVRSGPGPGR